jgi:molybdate transport system substrate-binding protein
MQKIKTYFFGLLIVAYSSFGVFSISSAAELRVAAAANLQPIFPQLQASFRKQTGHTLVPSFNSSGKFVAQIMQGAPFDVFLSADEEYPRYLYEKGWAQEPQVYAIGSLVLWTMKDFDLTHWPALLKSEKIHKIAIANPKTAPFGRLSLNVLTHAKLLNHVQTKLVLGESISQTNQYIFSGIADLGFTTKSVVMSDKMKGQGRWIELPINAYQPLKQAAVVLKQGKEKQALATQAFMVFLKSPNAQEIFKKNGYILP